MSTIEAVTTGKGTTQGAAAPEATDSTTQPAGKCGWIAVDLDGTLAYYHSWRGLEHIGKPVKSMLERVRNWIKEGYEVRVFTARASSPDLIAPIEAWLKKHKIGGLKVTNELDADCLEIWDDRCVQLISDTGLPYRSASVLARPRAPLLEEAFPHEGRPKLQDSPESFGS